MYGNPTDIIEISNIGKQNNIPIIEDCAQATGAIFNNKRVGSFGLLSCFSFYPTKNLGALGDGGMVVTSNSRLAKKIERIRQYGWNKKRDIKYVGINSRLDEIHATILNTKLKYLDADNEKRIFIANYYNKNLNFNRFKLPEKNILSKHVYYLYVIQVKNRKNIMNELLKKNIITKIHYKKAAHCEKKYAEKCKILKSRLKNTDKIVKKILSLPIYPQLKLKEVKYICDTINNIKN
jgi:dTDP-4-amino-4,6-dideoxygalactose transaminase